MEFVLFLYMFCITYLLLDEERLGVMNKCPFEWLHKSMSTTHKGNGNQHVLLKNDENQHTVYTLKDHDELNEQMRMIDLTDEDLLMLRRIKPEIESYMDRITDYFYKSVLDVNKLEQIIVKHSTIERLKQTLRDHLLEIFNGNVDETYISKRLGIAKVHKRVGLEPKWYLSAFQNLQNGFMQIIYTELNANDDERLAVVRTITKLLNLEQQLVLEAYERENLMEEQKQYERVKNDLKSKIANFSEELVDLSIHTNTAVEQLIASSTEVNHTFHKTTAFAVQSEQLAREGLRQMEELHLRIGEIYERTHKVEQYVQNLNDSSQMITHIVSAVEQIASQTKMLSLNATIEAARAGEHGRGFGVVAKEVSRLSEDSKQTVIRIADLIQQSNDVTAKVVSSIHEVQSLTDSGRQQSSETSQVFSSIVDAMKHSAGDIVHVEEQILELIATIEGIGAETAQAAKSADRFKQATSQL